ncbi:hypothetical protein [uncultured Methanobrevibacter sp.]|nr:hypothetical protein [uncultured Methanobrevibacter sp.]
MRVSSAVYVPGSKSTIHPSLVKLIFHLSINITRYKSYVLS